MANPDEQKQKAPQGLSWGSGAAAASPRQTEPGKEVVGVFGSGARTQTTPSTHPKAVDELFVPPVKQSPGHAGAFGAPPRGSFVPKQAPPAPAKIDLGFDEHSEPTRVVSFDELNAQVAGPTASSAFEGHAPSASMEVSASPSSKPAPAGLFGGATAAGGVTATAAPKPEVSTLIIEPKTPKAEVASRDAPAQPVAAQEAAVPAPIAAKREEVRPVAVVAPKPAEVTRPASQMPMETAASIATQTTHDKRSVVAAAPAPTKAARSESRSILEVVVPAPAAAGVFGPPARKESVVNLKAQLGATMLGVSPPPAMSKGPAPVLPPAPAGAPPAPAGMGAGSAVQQPDAPGSQAEPVREQPVSLPPEDVEFFLGEESTDPGAFVELDGSASAKKPPTPPTRPHAPAPAPPALPAARQDGKPDAVSATLQDVVRTPTSSDSPAIDIDDEEFSLGHEAGEPAWLAKEEEHSPSKVNATLVGKGLEADAVARLVEEAAAKKKQELAQAATLVAAPTPSASRAAEEAVDVRARLEAHATVEADAPIVRSGFPRRAIVLGALVGLLGGAVFALFSGNGMLATNLLQLVGQGPAVEAPAGDKPAPGAASPAVPATPTESTHEPAAKAASAEPSAPQQEIPEAEAKLEQPVAAAPEVAPAPAAEPVAEAPEAEPEAKAEPAPVPPPSAAAPEPAPAATLPAGASTAKVLSTARQRLAAGDAAGAEPLLRSVLAQDPDDHHVMEELARALLTLGRGAEALDFAERIVKRRPNRSAYYVILGDALKATGKADAAQQAYIQALDLDPDNTAATRRLQ